jgi:hypothetical protein
MDNTICDICNRGVRKAECVHVELYWDDAQQTKAYPYILECCAACNNLGTVSSEEKGDEGERIMLVRMPLTTKFTTWVAVPVAHQYQGPVKKVMTFGNSRPFNPS